LFRRDLILIGFDVRANTRFNLRSRNVLIAQFFSDRVYILLIDPPSAIAIRKIPGEFDRDTAVVETIRRCS
jgi:hypothetical protein